MNNDEYVAVLEELVSDVYDLPRHKGANLLWQMGDRPYIARPEQLEAVARAKERTA